MNVDNSLSSLPDFYCRLTPARNEKGWRPWIGKEWESLPDGSLPERPTFRRCVDWDMRHIPFKGIEDFHRLRVADAARLRSGAMIAGRIAGGEDRAQGVRRRSRRTVEDRPGTLVPEDFDAVPNILRIDPRREPERAARFLRSLLGPVVDDTTMSFGFSSSCCIGAGDEPPETLSALAHVQVDGVLDEAGRVAILQAWNLYATDQLRELGADIPEGRTVIDHRVGLHAQLQLIPKPRLPKGYADPLVGNRFVLVQGSRPTVDLAALRDFLHPWMTDAPASTERGLKLARRPVAARAASLDRPFLPLREMPLADLVDLPAVRSIVEEAGADRLANRMRKDRPYGTAIMSDRRVGQARAVREAISLARARVAWGAEHAELADWHRAGGVPEGLRDDVVFRIAALLAVAASPERVTDGTLRRAMHEVAEALGGEEWAREEWCRGGYARSVLERAERSARGETVEIEGREIDPRYAYALETVRRDLAVRHDEALALGLLSLADPSVAAHLRRRAAGHRSAVEVAEERRILRRKGLRLRRQGRSDREIAARLEVAPSTVRKLLDGRSEERTKWDFVLAGVGFRACRASNSCTHLVSLFEGGEDPRRPAEVLAVDVAPAVEVASAVPAAGTADAAPGSEGRRERRVDPPPATPVAPVEDHLRVAEVRPGEVVRLVPLGAAEREALARQVTARRTGEFWAEGDAGRIAQAGRAADALARSWDAVAIALGGEDDEVVQKAILAALEAARAAVRVGVDLRRGGGIMRIPFGTSVNAAHSLAGPILSAVAGVGKAEEAARRRARRAANADERFHFVLPLADLAPNDLTRHVARRAMAVRERFEPRIAEAMEAARRAAGRPVRMGEVPEALRLRRALHAVLKADGRAVRDGLREDQQGYAGRCLALLSPVQTAEGRQELAQLAGRTAHTPVVRLPAAPQAAVVRPAFLRPVLRSATPAMAA